MKILQFITQSKELLEEKMAEITARGLKRGQEALIDKLDSELDKLKDKKDKLLNLKAKDIDVSKWNIEYQDAQVDILTKEKELSIAKTTLEELFTEEVVSIEETR